MIKIDSSTDHIVCVQIPLSERQAFIDTLKKLLVERIAINVAAINGILNLMIGQEFTIDARHPSELTICLREEDCQELIEAIDEHILENGVIPLDHSLESLGASILPDELEDVVIETI
ncbi:hypothetical protein QQ056_06385 [Oscillatoria laete-virens NRMC-F 0139]|nr:hypothetical protein [Oscillatoria laete-virens]MDL5053172.1 hypothetical protein [Oscillatoria laete-virens NRMC-F 0139]